MDTYTLSLLFQCLVFYLVIHTPPREVQNTGQGLHFDLLVLHTYFQKVLITKDLQDILV